MSGKRYPVTDSGYKVGDVAKRLGVTPKIGSSDTVMTVLSIKRSPYSKMS
jgi:hypothetical protein